MKFKRETHVRLRKQLFGLGKKLTAIRAEFVTKREPFLTAE